MKPTVIMVALLSCACATPLTRDDPSAFKLMAEGQIPTGRVIEFTACLTDHFDKGQPIAYSWTVRQQVRPDGYRVETLAGAGPHITVSADVLHSGVVRMYESKAAALIKIDAQRKAFLTCMSRIGSTQAD